METVWSEECEQLLSEWSEKASCFRWLHNRCEIKYRRRYYCFSIPVIILSTLTGTANFGMDSYVPESSKSVATAIVGGLNLLAGILGTLQTFLKVAENMESHRSSGVAWSKLGRNISIELALDPSRRALPVYPGAPAHDGLGRAALVRRFKSLKPSHKAAVSTAFDESAWCVRSSRRNQVQYLLYLMIETAGSTGGEVSEAYSPRSVAPSYH
jgi:hypothetical protein